MKIHTLKIISWCALLLYYATLSTTPTTDEHKTILTTYLLKILDRKTTQTEGLVGNTLVKTVDEYTTIAALKSNDTMEICGMQKKKQMDNYG